MWIALCAGAVGFGVVSRAAGRNRRVSPDVASAALRIVGASGMFALAIVTGTSGAVPAAIVATLCGAVLTVDVRAVWVRMSARIGRVQASTVTPFQNATQPVIWAAASLGCG